MMMFCFLTEIPARFYKKESQDLEEIQVKQSHSVPREMCLRKSEMQQKLKNGLFQTKETYKASIKQCIN